MTFTEVPWIGTAGRGYLLVAHVFAPLALCSGNVNLHNTRPYVAGEQCSRCPASAPFCNKGLCAAEPTTEDDDVKLTMPAPVVTTQMPTTSAPTTQAPTTQTPTTKVQVTASPDSQPAKKGKWRFAGNASVQMNWLSIFPKQEFHFIHKTKCFESKWPCHCTCI